MTKKSRVKKPFGCIQGASAPRLLVSHSVPYTSQAGRCRALGLRNQGGKELTSPEHVQASVVNMCSRVALFISPCCIYDFTHKWARGPNFFVHIPQPGRGLSFSLFLLPFFLLLLLLTPPSLLPILYYSLPPLALSLSLTLTLLSPTHLFFLSLALFLFPFLSFFDFPSSHSPHSQSKFSFPS